MYCYDERLTIHELTLTMLSSTTLLSLSLFNILFCLVTVCGHESESFLKCQKYFKKVKDHGKYKELIETSE